MKMNRSVFTLILSLLLISGCSKLNNQNYSKINIGMSFKEVSALIGDPNSCDDSIGIKTCKWGSGKTSVTVNFADDAVALHSAENL
jgi:hypothetical protein